MLTWEEFLKTEFPHHALLISSTFFLEDSLSFTEFAQVAKTYCGIDMGSDWEQAAQHPDIIIVDRERKILRLEDVDAIHKNSHYPPLNSKRRLFFIDFCERLNVNSANSLLKIIEEPTTNALFLLTARHFENVLPTIASRCQKVRIAFDRPKKERPELDDEDEKWLTNIFKEEKTLTAELFSSLIKKSESLAKSYQTDHLMDVLAKHIAQAMKSRGEDFYSKARFLLADLQKWRKELPFNPSASLRLVKFFKILYI